MVLQPTCQTIPFAVASVRGLLCVIMDNSEFRDAITSFSQIVQCQQGSLYSGHAGLGNALSCVGLGVQELAKDPF